MPIDLLRDMLSEAGIPYENEIEFMPVEFARRFNITCPADGFKRNQVIYGRTSENSWKLDAIYHYGSYGKREGLLELWGELIPGDPITATVLEAFNIIKQDYEKTLQEEGAKK